MQNIPLSSVPENGCKGLSLDIDGQAVKVVIIRKNGNVYCYRNRCPHTGINLEWVPDQFLDISESLIQCATHGALFNIEDGYCISGPCAGQSLIPVQVEVDEMHFHLSFTQKK